jgi:hypothetical protein
MSPSPYAHHIQVIHKPDMVMRRTKKKFLDCYIRVSTTQQKTDGNSLVVQRHLGERVADKLGMEVRWRDEGAQSSTIGYRDVLGELKDDIRLSNVSAYGTN